MPKPKRCAYTEGKHRCPRNGTVQINERSWICQAHLVVLKQQVQRQQTPLGGLIADVLAGRKLSGDDISAVVDNLFGALGMGIFGQREQEPDDVDSLDGQEVRPPPQARARYVPPPDPRVAQARAERDERNRLLSVLGFAPDSRPTKDEIKKRVRELAMRHHPDRGGSVDRMAQINDAADRLSA